MNDIERIHLLISKAYELSASGEFHAAYPRAEEALHLARTLSDHQVASSDQVLCEALLALAELKSQEGLFDDAQHLLNEAHWIATNIPLDPTLQASVSTSLAMLYDLAGMETAARDYYRQAITLHHQAHPVNLHEIARLENNLGMILKSLHDYNGAAESYTRALQILENSTSVDATELASILNNLGTLQLAAGLSHDSLATHTRALHIRSHLLGGDHPDVAQSRGNLALVHYELKDYAKSGEEFEASLHILEKHLPKSLGDYQIISENYIDMLSYLGNSRAASALTNQVQKQLDRYVTRA